ncbi:DUF397 domain-containing protein [Nocardia araoensis]|uniref:DUF397 domain-containing protein n=1 Tax=Nocardia araoensis TaxID=228600 RepID=UPI000584A9A0|nr:DUF397 domain-containing protein [Nocardia araoensis]
MAANVGVRWFKSRHSATQADCVEVAFLDGGGVGVRDSKNPTGPALVFTFGDWEVLTSAMRAGRFTPAEA